MTLEAIGDMSVEQVIHAGLAMRRNRAKLALAIAPVMTAAMSATRDGAGSEQAAAVREAFESLEDQAYGARRD